MSDTFTLNARAVFSVPAHASLKPANIAEKVDGVYQSLIGGSGLKLPQHSTRTMSRVAYGLLSTMCVCCKDVDKVFSLLIK